MRVPTQLAHVDVGAHAECPPPGKIQVVNVAVLPQVLPAGVLHAVESVGNGSVVVADDDTEVEDVLDRLDEDEDEDEEEEEVVEEMMVEGTKMGHVPS